MSNKLKLYVAFIVALGFVFLGYSIGSNASIDIRNVIIFAALSIAAESLLIYTSDNIAISTGFAVDLAAILVIGVPEAAWIASIGVMLRIIKHNGKRYHILNFPIYKTLFNGATVLLSAGMAGITYKLLGGATGAIDFNSFLIPLLACIVVYTVVNETIVSGLMSNLTGEPFRSSWLSNVLWAARDCIYVAPIGVLMAIAYMQYDIVGILLFLGPLLLARYSYKLYMDMRRGYMETVKALSQAVEVKDAYTQGHSLRVSEYAYALGKRVNLSPGRLENLRMAAILHDIGKIGIEERILNKPGKLTEEEYEKIKQHPVNGVKIIQDIEFLSKVSEIILDHHEKMDGTGYPNGKKKGEISTEAAILSVADVYDALTTDRPYRNAMSVQKTLSIIKEGKGKDFSPRLVNEFIKMIEERSEKDN